MHGLDRLRDEAICQAVLERHSIQYRNYQARTARIVVHVQAMLSLIGTLPLICGLVVMLVKASSRSTAMVAVMGVMNMAMVVVCVSVDHDA